MSLTLVGLIGIVAMVVLLILGVPIALAMAVTGAVGLWVLEGPGPALAHTLLIPWDEGRSFVFVTIPLFVLMGQLVFHTGLAADLYQGVRTWISRVPGGMAITSVVACGAFGAVTGSSIATVATMGAIVMPEMRRYKYHPRLATGALAASGTLGILIPPSLIFIFYGDDDRDVDRRALHRGHRFNGDSDRRDVLGDHPGQVRPHTLSGSAGSGRDVARAVDLNGGPPADPGAVPPGDRRYLWGD